MFCQLLFRTAKRLHAAAALGCAIALAGCGGGDQTDPAEGEMDLHSAVRVKVTASTNPSTVSANQDVVVSLSVTSSASITADVSLRVLAPDGSTAFTASWPASHLSRTPLVLDKTITIGATDPPGAYSIGASAQRTGSSTVLFDANNLATFTVAGPAQAPVVATSAASNLGAAAATLNGSANPNGSAATGWFRYATSNPGSCNDTFGTRAPASGGASLGSGSSSVAFSQALTGLTAGTTYFFCAIASNAGGTGFGPVLSFATTSPSGSPDLVVTQTGISPSSPITGEALTFSATVKNQGTAATPAGTIVGVLFGVDGTAVTWSDSFTQALAAGASVTLTANGGPSGSATWTATSGSHQLLAFVDDVNRIPESNENNNQLTQTFTVGTSCAPACTGKVCGPDGCGGSCGTCSSGQSCNASGQCVAACTPSCSGKVCGPDGCGGSCGTCSSGQSCNSSGQCVATCTPSCTGKVCGPDGCGGSCGTCSSGTCDSTGQCASNLPPLWNALPPAGLSPAPSGPVVGVAGQFDTGTLATNEVWDNFDGASGANPDSRLWIEDTINQGGTQVYDPARSFLDGSGNAVLEAIQSGSTIFSGRFTSRTKFNMQYGWCAGRIKFPKAGRSWFPAFWLLHIGFNTGNPYGEIDMMEFFGDTTKYSTHVYLGDPQTTLASEMPVPASQSGGNAGDGFHTYWMMWEQNRMRIGVDDLIIGDWNPASVPAGIWNATAQPFYFIANFAVAPSWLPAPLPTDFPSRMLIDWIWYKPL